MAFFDFFNTAADKVRGAVSSTFNAIKNLDLSKATASAISSTAPKTPTAPLTAPVSPTPVNFAPISGNLSTSSITGTPQSAGNTSPVSLGSGPLVAPLLPGLSVGTGGQIVGTPQLPSFIASPFVNTQTQQVQPTQSAQTPQQRTQAQQTPFQVTPTPVQDQNSISSPSSLPSPIQSQGQRGQGISAGRGSFLPNLFGVPTAQAEEQRIGGLTIEERARLQQGNQFASFLPQIQNFSSLYNVPSPSQNRGFGISTEGSTATNASQITGVQGQTLNLVGIKSLADTLTALNESLNNIRLQVEQNNPLPQTPIIPPPQDRLDLQKELFAEWDNVQKQLGIPQAITEMDAAQKDLQAITQGFNKSIEDVQNDPDLSKTLKSRWLKFIEDKSKGVTDAATNRYNFALKKYEVLSGQLKDKFSIVEKAFNIQNQQQDNARQQLQMLISSGGIAKIDSSTLQQWSNVTGIDVKSLAAMRDAVKANDTAKLNKINAEIQNKLLTQQLKAPERDSTVNQILENGKGTDGFVAAKTYQDALRNFISLGGTQANFLASFPQQTYLRQQEIDKLPASLRSQQVVSKTDLTPQQLGVVNDAKATWDAAKQLYKATPELRQQIIQRALEVYGFDLSPYF